MNTTLLLAVLGGILLLLWLILKLRLPAFIALLITSIATGLMAGMDPAIIMETVKTGMASTLGFVATVVGLGAIFGGILEHTGGATALATWLLSKTGNKNAPLALSITGFLVSIPVFFDVGFIILYPVIAALHHKTGKSIIHYALPLLAGLAVTHAFIPPTPGPLAVAEIIGAPLGWIVIVGVIVGIPAAGLSGIIYGKYLGKKLHITVPQTILATETPPPPPAIIKVLPIMILPIILIVCSTLIETGFINSGSTEVNKILGLLCHPFSALLIANVLAWYILGRGSGLSANALSSITAKSLHPAGIIILVTGAGGVFKQVLIDTGAGEMVAASMQAAGLSIIAFAFLAAALIRVLQGSATVAMITGAGLVAPVLAAYQPTDIQLAAIVISIASGATMASHLNDSGFWLIKEYLGLSEKDAMRTWTVASSILGISGFLLSALIFYLF
ncbi:MAG TPA: gluconate:H+ symporter [Saprospiraceae bacterium]|mgnify:FL=1|nr:gluconate:H+ symporter [Saprospiraceae bacterium]HMP25411.1 gluconate:H+ symporter [Saprospiraceae bacterium]